MADPITIPGYQEEQEEKKPQPIDREIPKKEQAAGFFRQHPLAKWVLALLVVVYLVPNGVLGLVDLAVRRTPLSSGTWKRIQRPISLRREGFR